MRAGSFDVDKFIEGSRPFEGYHCFKNLVKINNREPDPKGYYRNINKVEVLVKEPSEDDVLLLGDGVIHKNIYTRIVGKSFIWAQIRIMISTMLRYSHGEFKIEELENLLTGDEKALTLSGGKTFHKRKAKPQGLYLTRVDYDLDKIIKT